jgi:hypothetical protein
VATLASCVSRLLRTTFPYDYSDTACHDSTVLRRCVLTHTNAFARTDAKGKPPCTQPRKGPSRVKQCTRPTTRPTDDVGRALVNKARGPDKRRNTQFQAGQKRERPPEEATAVGKAIQAASKRAVRKHPQQNDSQGTARALEQEQWSAAHAWMTSEFDRRSGVAARETPEGTATKKRAQPQTLSPQSATLKKRHGAPKLQLYKILLGQCKEKFPAVNWVTEQHPKGPFKVCPARKMCLDRVGRQLRCHAQCVRDWPLTACALVLHAVVLVQWSTSATHREALGCPRGAAARRRTCRRRWGHCWCRPSRWTSSRE